MFRRCIRTILLVTCLGAGNATAEAVATAPSAGPPTEVSGPEISIMIRTTIIALHQANVTGNYTVLRDLGATVLQAADTPADLAAQFADFRAKQIGLAPTVLYDPVLDQKPQLSTDGRLHLVGHFPTKPQEVVFDLTYLYQNGAWRIAVISVLTRTASDTTTPAVAGKPTAQITAPADLVPDIKTPPRSPPKP